jgi:ribonucleoside-diphosphate reductase alpha chain
MLLYGRKRVAKECEECEIGLGGTREEIFKLRYAINKDETWDEASVRVGNVVSMAEVDEVRKEWASRFTEIIKNMYFIPGGRILRNAGRKKGMLINCYILGVDDNRESIGQLWNDFFVVSGTGGGVGTNWSDVRPIGDSVMGAGGVSSGVLSFMKVKDSVAEVVKIGGSRRAAGLDLLGCRHPEIFSFIEAKVKEGELANSNISVGVTHDFIRAIKKNKEWDLRFGNKNYKTIKARKLWDFIIHNAWTCGDPGLVNLDNMVNLNPTYYFETVEAPNPCGEVPAPRNGCCDLGSINLSELYNVVTNSVNWTRLKETIFTAVRFLDNVLDITYYPLKKIEVVSISTRRIGMGVMGLHYLLLKMGIKNYGSDESLEFMDELFNKIRDYAYLASIELAQEKGTFEKFDMDKYMEGAFVKTLPRRVTSKLKKYGIRNGAILSMPPTGTTALVAGVSQGLEAIFSPVYKRKFNVEDKHGKSKVKEVLEVGNLCREFVREGKDTSHFIGAYQISPWEHMEVQTTCQKYVDNSISKTINMRKDFPKEELSELLLEHLPEIKGTTLYREGSKGMEILVPVDHSKMRGEEILKI